MSTKSSQIPSDCAILIVDDEAHLLTLYEQILTDEGYVVKTALTRTAALDALKDFTPNFIFLDCRMGGMSNADFKAGVDRIVGPGKLPIIGFSSFSEQSSFAEEMRATLGRFVEKPDDLEKFLKVVNHLCFEKK